MNYSRRPIGRRGILSHQLRLLDSSRPQLIQQSAAQLQLQRHDLLLLLQLSLHFCNCLSKRQAVPLDLLGRILLQIATVLGQHLGTTLRLRRQCVAVHATGLQGLQHLTLQIQRQLRLQVAGWRLQQIVFEAMRLVHQPHRAIGHHHRHVPVEDAAVHHGAPQHRHPVVRHTALRLAALLVALDHALATPDALIVLRRIEDGQWHILHRVHDTGQLVALELAVAWNVVYGRWRGKLPFGVELAIGGRQFLAQANSETGRALQAGQKFGALCVSLGKLGVRSWLV